MKISTHPEEEKVDTALGQQVNWQPPRLNQLVFCLRAPVEMHHFIAELAKENLLADRKYTLDFFEVSGVFDTAGFYLKLPLTLAEIQFIDNVLMSLWEYSQKFYPYWGARDYEVGLNYLACYHVNNITKKPIEQIYTDGSTVTVKWASMCLPGYTEERAQLDKMMSYLSTEAIQKISDNAKNKNHSAGLFKYPPKDAVVTAPDVCNQNGGKKYKLTKS